MRKGIILLTAAFLLFSLTGCNEFKDIKGRFNNDGGKKSGLSNAEIAKGLKAALDRGITLAVRALNKQNGYYRDALVKIPFPPEARKAARKLRQLGMGSLVDRFVRTMNRGAERAAKEAVRIFTRAIRNMTLSDARKILFGKDTAATDYFKRQTRDVLKSSFEPHIRQALRKVGAIRIWRKLARAYNRTRFLGRGKINTDIVDYATGRALDGLFLKVERVERKIRKNPAARVSKILKKVFSRLD